jgi:hypothetical protein
MGFSMSKLSRIEHANRGLDPDDVLALLGLYRGEPGFSKFALGGVVPRGFGGLHCQSGDELLNVVEEPRDGKLGSGPCSLAQEQL